MEKSEYTRIRLKGKTMYLRIMAETDTFLKGVEVDKEADEISGKDFDERVHLIEKECIAKRTPVAVDKHYGELVHVPAWRR